MGWLSNLFGSDEYNDDKGRSMGARIINDPNPTLQGRQDEVLANESVARLVSPEGRAEIFQGIAGRLDKAYSNALMIGSGNLSRAGLGSGSASALLRTRMTKDRMESVNAATTQADVAAGQFVSGLFGQFRQEHLGMNQMRLNYEAGLQGHTAASVRDVNQFTQFAVGEASGALESGGSWLASLGGP